MTIDGHLSFNEHVNRIAHKTNTVKAFLQRNIKSYPLQVKENCYKIIVRTIMEYACTIWSSYTKRISKYMKKYKEEQPGLLITITPFFQCYGYDAGLRMAHIRREDGLQK